MGKRFAQLEAFMDRAMEGLNVSGIDCIVYQDHQELFRHSAGYSNLEERTPMAPDALYNIYSASKVITCTAALQLVEQGKLLLQDPLSAYLPEFAHMKVKRGTFQLQPAQKEIRIADLFSMTAGISYELDTPAMRALKQRTGGDFSTRDFVGALAEEPLLFEPGESWNYSYCHDILGAVIEVVSGLSFGAYLKANIFDPLGMADTGFSVPEEKLGRLAPQYEYTRATGAVRRITSACQGAAGLRHESGGGGLISTTADYILFADALACGGVGKNGARILSPAAIRLMSSNHLAGPCLDRFHMMASPGVGYGLGVATIMDPAAAYSFLPKGSFYWGGIGGVQNLIDPENRLSYFVAQHTMNSPKERLNPYMWNTLYAEL